MSGVRTELPHVMDAGSVEALADQIYAAGSLLQNTAQQAADRWRRLPEVFEVEDAAIANVMLDGPKSSAEEFMEAMSEAKRLLMEFAMYSIPELQKRRDALATRITEANAASEAAQSAIEYANTAYWSAYETDPTSETTRKMGEAQTEATDAWRAADTAVEQLEADIRAFCVDLEAEESYLASDLRGISGGDDPRGAWGAPLTVAQTFWGDVSVAYPGGSTEASGLADSLRADMSTAVANKIEWLGTLDADAAEKWLDEHPDFASAITFVDVERAAEMWDGLQERSTRGEDGTWETGPLARLYDSVPAAVGNLNGIPAVVKDEFNRAELARLLAGDIAGDRREQLEQVSTMLTDAEERSEPPLSLLSLFLETDDASPRTSIGFGDVDSADQITAMTHGIGTDLAQLDDWSRSAREMQQQTGKELAKRGSSDTTAVVLFMEWDSGDVTNVLGIERPDAGAERLSQLLRGYDQTNPDAQVDLQLHSLGTSMGVQMIVDNPGLVDNAWLFGSAGVSVAAGEDLAKLIKDGKIDIYATHATDDFIAEKGRMIKSDHPIDPLDIDGVLEFESDGGWVYGYGDDGKEWGMRVEGHNAQASTELLYRLEGVTMAWYTPNLMLVPILDDEAVGYLDPRSQAFKQSVVDLTESIIAADEAEE